MLAVVGQEAVKLAALWFMQVLVMFTAGVQIPDSFCWHGPGAVGISEDSLIPPSFRITGSPHLTFDCRTYLEALSHYLHSLETTYRAPTMAYSNVIAALKQAIPNGIFTERGKELYEKLNGSYLSGFESDLKPYWIVQPRTPEDVAAFLKVVSKHSDSIAFAVRGGGQQPVPGCANIQDGITLDLGLLTGIESRDGIVKVGAGERWVSVYEKLGEDGLTAAGGRSAANGIGGLALEGLSLRTCAPWIGGLTSCRWIILLLQRAGLHLRQCCQLRGRSRLGRDHSSKCQQPRRSVDRPQGFRKQPGGRHSVRLPDLQAGQDLGRLPLVLSPILPQPARGPR